MFDNSKSIVVCQYVSIVIVLAVIPVVINLSSESPLSLWRVLHRVLFKIELFFIVGMVSAMW